MYSFGYLLLAAATILAVTAKPHASPRSLHIDDMKNRTVCAMDVKITDDPNRIPRYIKEIKCARKTDQWCTQNQIPLHECCHHTKNEHLMECAEMTDKVQVFYKDRNHSEQLEVAVGCTCLIEHGTTAPSPGGPW